MTFDELVEGGEAAVERLLGKQETLDLEFKSLDPREPIFKAGTLEKSGRKHLAKEASAFANSAGGLIVFGIDCRAIDGIDQAEKLTPIENVQRAETSVRDAAAELLQPRHDGIRVASIPTAAEPTRGYIIVDVPRSERRPHRSEATGQKEYYKRSGSRSYPMEHYDIEDAFRRSASPILALEVSFVQTMQIGIDEYRYAMQLAIENVSETTAKMVSLQIWNRRGAAYGRDQYAAPLVKETTYDGKTHLAGPVDFAVHPGEKRYLHKYTFNATTSIQGKLMAGQSEIALGSIGFDYSISAENMRMIVGRYSLIEKEMGPFQAGLQAASRRKFPQ